jgi:hypothetical protein
VAFCYRRENGSWWIAYRRADGKPVRRRTLARTKDEAMTEAVEWQRREDMWRTALQGMSR